MSGASIPSRQLVESIWRAAVRSVDSAHLVKQAIRIEDHQVAFSGTRIPVKDLRRILVVGAGKAGAGMAQGAEESLAGLGKPMSGWVNVPADCVRPLTSITLHPARPAGLNEPTAEGVTGSEEILRRVAALGEGDLCLVLISGGGSALLPAPIAGISLAEKAATIRQMSLAGAGIDELNCVRRQLSRIKGGGLARACQAQWLVTLVISDVIGDPLEVIASGPTIDFPPEPQRALELLEQFAPGLVGIPESVVEALQQPPDSIEAHASFAPVSEATTHRHVNSGPHTEWSPVRAVSIIGNNQTAIDAAERTALSWGMDVRVLGVGQAGIAKTVGRDLAEECLRVQAELTRPLCLISGGEPVVRVEKRPGPQKGGRNQELALAALCRLIESNAKGITILSGGTDGEDGPTDAAGAMADSAVMQATTQHQLDPQQFLADHNSYPFFEQTGGLLRTGPTHTNVMDVRVALVEPLPEV